MSGPYIILLDPVRGVDTGAAQAPRAVEVPLSGCGLSFSVKDPDRQSRSKGNDLFWGFWSEGVGVWDLGLRVRVQQRIGRLGLLLGWEGL